MDGEAEKPFDTVAIILLIFIAGTSDAADLVSVLIFPVPAIGQIVYFGNAFLISPLTWATIQLWFIMKIGFSGRVGLLNLAGGIGNVIGIPGSETTTVIIATWLANHPKATAVAQMAAGKAGGAEKAAEERRARQVATKKEAGGGVGRSAEKERVGEAGMGEITEKEIRQPREREAEQLRPETTEGRPGVAVGAPETARGAQVAEPEKGISQPQEKKPPRPEIPKEAFGEKPTPLEELAELTKKPLPEEKPKEDYKEGEAGRSLKNKQVKK